MNGMPTTCCSHIGQLLIVAGNATWLAHNKWKHWLSLLTKLLWELLLKNWTAGFQNIPFSLFLVFPISTFAKMQCISFSVVEFLDMQWEMPWSIGATTAIAWAGEVWRTKCLWFGTKCSTITHFWVLKTNCPSWRQPCSSTLTGLTRRNHFWKWKQVSAKA